MLFNGLVNTFKDVGMYWLYTLLLKFVGHELFIY